MRRGLRMVGLSAMSIVVLSTQACEGTPPRRIGVRPGTSGAQAIAASERANQAERAELTADDLNVVTDKPAPTLKPVTPAPAPKPTPAKAPEPAPQRRGTIESPRPLDKPVSMTRAERATLREQALALLVNTAAGGSPEERVNALEALAGMPARLATVVDGALQDQSVAVRTVGCMVAGKAKLRETAPQIRRLLQDDSRYVRSAAIYALHTMGQRPDATPLAGMLFDPNPKIRAQAALIMGEMGEQSALGPLREAAKTPTGIASPGEVRVMDLQIAEARFKLGDKDAIADIRSALFPSRVEDLESCYLGIQMAGRLGDQSSTNRLIELTAKNDARVQEMPPDIRMGAAMALARLGQPEGSYIGLEFYASDKEALRAQAAHLFGAIGRQANLSVLSRMMADTDGRVRVAAASAIVKITDGE